MTVGLIVFFVFIVVGIATGVFFLTKMNRSDARKQAAMKYHKP